MKLKFLDSKIEVVFAFTTLMLVSQDMKKEATS